MAVDPAAHDVSPSTWRCSPHMLKPGMRCCIGPNMWSTVVTVARTVVNGTAFGLDPVWTINMMPLHPEDTTTFHTEDWQWDKPLLVERQ